MKCRLSVSGFASGFLRCTGITEVNQSLSVFSPFTKTKSLFFVINKMSLLYSLMNWALSVYKLNLKMMSPIPSVELGMQCPPGYGPQPTPWGQIPQCPPWTAPPICPSQSCWPPVYYPPCWGYGPSHGHGVRSCLYIDYLKIQIIGSQLYIYHSPLVTKELITLFKQI